MEKEIIEIIKEEIDRLDKIIKEDSKLISNNRDVYNILKPKGKDFRTINVIKLSDNKELLNKLVNLVGSSNLVAVEDMIKKKIEFDNYDKEVNEKLISAGLTKDFIYSDAFINYVCIKSKQNKRLLKVYNELLEMRQREIELFKQNEEIVMFICNTFINMYEDVINEKEKLKYDKKSLLYTIENINKKEKLSIRNLSSLEELYNVLDLEKQKKLVAFIQNYNKKIEKEVKIKKESIKVLDTKEEKDIKIKYMDNEPLEHVIDPLSIQAKNMLDSLNGLDKDMVFKMLENLSSNKNFITIINYMINFVEDYKLQSYLEEFIENYFESNIKYKEEETEDNKVLYYGFSLNKNFILNDIENISEEYYKDISKAIKKVKRCDFNSNTKSITVLKKVFEVRVNAIRITCKRIDENTYVILGIYCKKKNRDRKLIVDTYNRLKLIDSVLDNIDDVKKIDGVWSKYIEINEFFDDEINIKLNSKIKHC